MNRITRFVSLLALATAACSTPNNTPDVLDATSSDGLVFPDVPGDATSTGSSYRACAESAECDLTPNTLGLPEICDLTFPGGMCRRIRCTDNSQCGALGVCSERDGCIPRCTRQSDTCTQYGAVCLAFQLPFLGNGGCFPACDPNVPRADGGVADGGARACLRDLTCDPYLGECVSRVVSSGRENGEPCAIDGDCRSGICIPEVDVRIDTRATGFLDGYCVSHAPLPTESVFAARRGMNLPTSSCPPNSVVLPAPDNAPGSAARCLKACTSDAMCRAGYRCDRMGGGTAMFANGGCVPIDCATAGASCPAGTSCTAAVVSDGGTDPLFTGSRCLRASDAGAPSDAGSDATASDSSSADSSADAGADAATPMDAAAG